LGKRGGGRGPAGQKKKAVKSNVEWVGKKRRS